MNPITYFEKFPETPDTTIVFFERNLQAVPVFSFITLTDYEICFIIPVIYVDKLRAMILDNMNRSMIIQSMKNTNQKLSILPSNRITKVQRNGIVTINVVK